MNVSGEYELDPEELSGLFEARGWVYHVNGGLFVPNATDIEDLLARLVTEAMNKPEDVVAVQGGRFMVWKDPELPGSFDLFLNIGFVWDDDALATEGVSQ